MKELMIYYRGEHVASFPVEADLMGFWLYASIFNECGKDPDLEWGIK